MDKFKITLTILFIIGVIGALNSISNQSTIEQEKGFINSVLSVLGLKYKPEPQEARDFDYVPAKTKSELSRIAGENPSSTPSAARNQEIQPRIETPPPSQKPLASPSSASYSPSPSPSPYGFGFSN